MQQRHQEELEELYAQFPQLEPPAAPPPLITVAAAQNYPMGVPTASRPVSSEMQSQAVAELMDMGFENLDEIQAALRQVCVCVWALLQTPKKHQPPPQTPIRNPQTPHLPQV
jgi:hypothetical protein